MTDVSRALEERWARFYNAEATGDVSAPLPPPPSTSFAASTRRRSTLSAAAAPAETSQASHDALEQRLLSVEERIKAKQEAAERRALHQLRLEGEEMDRWHEYHVQEAAREQQREADALEQARLEQLRREQYERDNAEELRIEGQTAHLTPRSKQRWLADDAELKALEREMETRDSKLAALNRRIGGLVGEYEARLAREAAEAQLLEEHEAAVQQLFEETLRDARAEVEIACFDSHEATFAEFVSHLRGELHAKATVAREAAAAAARDRVLPQLADYDRARVEAAATVALRNELLDELVEVDVLRQKLKKQLGRK